MKAARETETETGVVNVNLEKMVRNQTKKVKFVPFIIHPLAKSLKSMDTEIMVARIRNVKNCI